MTSMSILRRITKLENTIGWFHPGIQNALRWYLFIERCALRTWVFRTEHMRSTRDPYFLDKIGYFRFGSRREFILDNMELRTEFWHMIFWTKVWGDNNFIYIQGDSDPNIPTVDDTKQFMDLILADIEPLAIEWAEEYLAEGIKYESVGELREFNLELIARELLSIKGRAKYHRNAKIKHPENYVPAKWVINIYRDRGIRRWGYWIIHHDEFSLHT